MGLSQIADLNCQGSRYFGSIQYADVLFELTFKFVRYLVSCNLGHEVSFFGSVKASIEIMNKMILQETASHVKWVRCFKMGEGWLGQEAAPASSRR